MSQMLRGTPVQYQLKHSNLFYLEFPGELGIESWQVQTTSRPKMTINPVDIPYLNTTFFTAGKYLWEPLTITLIDPVGPSTSQQVMEWVRLHAESVTGRMGVAAGYKKDLVLRAVGPSGITVEKWVIYQAMITNVDFGENDHGNDQLQMITVTIQPDWCVLTS